MKFSALIALAVFVTGCERTEPLISESRSPISSTALAISETVVGDSSPSDLPPGWSESGFCTGVARLAADHSEKMNRASVLIGDVAYLFRGDYQSFEADDIGKPIRVRGVMVEDRLPMFILPDDYEGLVPPGMPMPPGTNLEEESHYYFIKDPKWEIIDEQAEQDAAVKSQR